MKILITGNSGYVGSMVVKYLREKYPHANIIGYDMGYFANMLSSCNVLPETYLNAQYFGDVRNFPIELLEGVDAIVHLAAISNDPMGNQYEDVTMDVNYHSAIDIARKAKQAGVKRFVYASSCSVYGFTQDGAKTEASDVNPLTAYAKSKVFTERELKGLASSEFIVTSLRFATACGMSDRLRLDLVLNDFVASALLLNKITILSDGTPWRPLINVNDMARAIDWAASRSEGNGGTYLVVNTGSNEWNYQVKDLAQAVKEFMPGTSCSINKDAAPDKRSYQVSFELFKSLAPENQPIHNLAVTIKDLVEGLRVINLRESNFRESNFMRLKHLNSLKEKDLLTEQLRWKR